MEEPILNRVAQSGLIVLDPEDYLKDKSFMSFPLDSFLEEGILREKTFRQRLAEHSFEIYRDKYVLIPELSDAIIPYWAYMLVSSSLSPYAAMVYSGSLQEFKEFVVMNEFLRELSSGKFKDKKIVLKGCGKEKLSHRIYTFLSRYLVAEVRSLMYGEPCSTVPVFKKR